MRLAVEKGAPVEVLERLVALQQAVDAEAGRRAFFAAMARFQSSVPRIKKTRTVPLKSGARAYDYAPLEEVIDTIRETEAACGLMHSWNHTEHQGGGLTVTCCVSHVSGHTHDATVTIPPTQGINTSAAQNVGIMLTYGQRRSLLAAYGLTTGGEDRDGAEPAETDEVIGQDALTNLQDLLHAKGRTAAALLQWLSKERGEEIRALADLRQSEYVRAVVAMGGRP